MKKNHRRLSLDRETLRTLTLEGMRAALGGRAGALVHRDLTKHEDSCGCDSMDPSCIHCPASWDCTVRCA
jgi:hypothetical protein